MFLKNSKILALVLGLLLVVSCDFSFLEDGGSDELGAGLREEVFVMSNASGTIHRFYDIADALVYSLEKYTDASGHCVEIHRYGADDSLESVALYSRNASGCVTQEAYFGADKVLRWFSVYSYDADGNEVANYTYNAQSEATGAEARTWASGAALGKESRIAYYDANLAANHVWDKTYDEAGKLLTTKYYTLVDGVLTLTENTVLEYNSDNKVMFETTSSREAAALLQAAAHGVSGLTLPALPAAPSLGAIVLQDSTLTVDGKTWWIYDPLGSTSASFEPAVYAGITVWRPQGFTRSDTRYSRDFAVTLAYDDLGRPVSKVSTYGEDEILNLGLSWDAAGYPETLSMRGAALISPQDWTIGWEETIYAGYTYKFPRRLSLSVNDVVLQYFEWEYRNPGSIPQLDVNDLESLKDGSFGLDVLEYLGNDQVLAIKHFDGDDTLVETFSFAYSQSADASGHELTVTVSDGAGLTTGSYKANLDLNGQKTSLSAYNAAAAQLWSYEYAYAADLALAVDWSGRVMDKYLPAGIDTSNPLAFAEQLTSTVVYDLLF